MIDDTSRLHTWSIQIISTSSVDYTKVENVKFNYAGSKIVACMNFNNNYLMFMILSASDGTVLYSLRETPFYNGEVYDRSLLLESTDHIVATLKINNGWYLLRLAPAVGTSATSVFTIGESTDISFTRSFTVEHDDVGGVESGYFVTGYVDPDFFDTSD